MERKALKLALEALKIWEQMYPKSSASPYRTPAITAIKEALAQPVKEPYGYDWSMLETTQESLREHMAMIHELEAALKQALEVLETSTDWNVSATGRQLKSMQVITALRTRLAQPPLPVQPEVFTTGHCREKAKPGGCQLHNIHCGFPDCDRKKS